MSLVDPILSLAHPALSLASTIALAFVIGEFVLPDLVRSRRAARLWSLPVYAVAILWPLSPGSAWLGLAFAGILVGCDLLPTGRGVPAVARMTWGYAVLGLRTATFCLFAALVLMGLPSGRPEFCLPAAAVRAILWTTAYVFVLPGGTILVRYVLDAANPAWRDQVPSAGQSEPAPWPGSAPRSKPASRTTREPMPGAVKAPSGTGENDPRPEIAAASEGDRTTGRAAELRRGRFIGNVERLIVTTLVCLGQYGAIGVILAAKSLARYPQLSDSRDFAEYYLIGTLVSMAVAIAAGMVLASVLAWV